MTGEEERRKANAGKRFLFSPPLPLPTVMYSLVQRFLHAGILTARVLNKQGFFHPGRSGCKSDTIRLLLF